MYLRQFGPPLDPPEPEVVTQCSWCGEDICVGDDYYETPDGAWVCQYCMDVAHKIAEAKDIIDPWEDLRIEEAIEKWKGINNE